MSDADRTYLKEHMTFGVLFPPHFSHLGDPAWQLRKTIKLAVDMEELGFDEVWVGEHYAGGNETIADPVSMLAAIGERTSQIKLGTGVVSMSYHHPFVVANKMAQLDNMTRGRVMFGTGPGKLPIDAYMMGIDTAVQRRRQGEAIEACKRLLDGEIVSMETDWFKLREAQLQLMPYKGPGEMEMLAASLSTPSGPMLAGKNGLSLFSLSGGTPESFATLDTNWKAYEETSLKHGHTARREKWRMMGPMFLGETHAEVDRACARRLPPNVEYIADVVKLFYPNQAHEWMASPQATLDAWRSDTGIPLYGKGTFGPPEEAIREIERLWDKSGGFGGFVILMHDLADYESTRRSLELFAEEVIPHFRAYRNRARTQSLHYVNANVERLYKPVVADGAAAKADYERSKTGTSAAAKVPEPAK